MGASQAQMYFFKNLITKDLKQKFFSIETKKKLMRPIFFKMSKTETSARGLTIQNMTL